jgi:hypothetical protein
VPKVVVLERIQWLESEARGDLFDSETLVRIYVFRHRPPRMHKVGWTGKRSSAAMCLCWFVFERDHAGPPTLHWLRLPRPGHRANSAGQPDAPTSPLPYNQENHHG